MHHEHEHGHDSTRHRPEEAGAAELWRGLEELAGSPEYVEQSHREFPEGAAEWDDPVSRRRFLTIMGASAALAGAAGCSPRPAPRRQIYPYVTQPEQVT